MSQPFSHFKDYINEIISETEKEMKHDETEKLLNDLVMFNIFKIVLLSKSKELEDIALSHEETSEKFDKFVEFASEESGEDDFAKKLDQWVRTYDGTTYRRRTLARAFSESIDMWNNENALAERKAYADDHQFDDEGNEIKYDEDWNRIISEDEAEILYTRGEISWDQMSDALGGVKWIMGDTRTPNLQ